MDLKEKMMESMMGKMSAEERSAMMDKMMEQFFDGMSAGEKQDMMMKMMPKMMGQMMGGDGGMMGMCAKMMSRMSQSSEMAAFATPELRGLFDEWVQQLEAEVMESVKGKEEIDPEELAAKLKISKESTVYLLSRLAQKGVLKAKYKA
jgi:hypothetical protein